MIWLKRFLEISMESSGKAPLSPASRAAAHGVLPGPPRLHKIRSDLPDDLPRLFVDARVAAKVAGIVISDLFYGFYPKVKVLREIE